MKIPLAQRIGKRRPITECSVHIEHTIPCNEIDKILWAQRNSLLVDLENKSLPELLHNLYLKLSVCTALTKKEEKDCIGSEFRDVHPAFLEGELVDFTDLGQVKPFERYNFKEGLKIFNVLTGLEIEPRRWTLDDHARTLSSQDIYRWEFFGC